MARCPAGHESQASDYCDTCGLVIGGESPGTSAAPPIAVTTPSPVGSVPGTAGAGPSGGPAGSGGGGCPVCSAERNGRFCEECGYDFDLAEAMPHVSMTPGVPPAEPVATVVESASLAAAPTAAVSTAVPSTAASSTAVSSSVAAPAEQGLDLEAELARAEAEANSARAAEAGSSAASGASVSSGFFAAGEESAAASSVATEFSVPAEPGAQAPAGATTSSNSATAPDEAEPESAAPLPATTVAGAFSALSGLGAAAEELALVVDADADYYAAQVGRGDIIESEFPFPKYAHERRFTFTEGPVRIGRASSSRGIDPEIDLTGPPLDPAVSHLHAQLLRHDEGWVVVDLGSANGTRLNDAEEPLEAETEIPVKQGDRIHLGVWTTITVQ